MIDILLACYNGGPFLKEQLTSIINQGFQDWHLIVGDDGSTDDTLAILEEYVQKRKHKISVTNNGLSNSSTCRNFASLLEKSTADYLMFCDQDDIWLPEKIDIFIREMTRLEEAHGKQP